MGSVAMAGDFRELAEKYAIDFREEEAQSPKRSIDDLFSCIQRAADELHHGAFKMLSGGEYNAIRCSVGLARCIHAMVRPDKRECGFMRRDWDAVWYLRTTDGTTGLDPGMHRMLYDRVFHAPQTCAFVTDDARKRGYVILRDKREHDTSRSAQYTVLVQAKRWLDLDGKIGCITNLDGRSGLLVTADGYEDTMSRLGIHGAPPIHPRTLEQIPAHAVVFSDESLR
jgi:hypothetical protein